MESCVEGAGFVLIRTSFRFPSAQALEPLTGQPHLPRPVTSMQPSLCPHELGGTVSGALSSVSGQTRVLCVCCRDVRSAISPAFSVLLGWGWTATGPGWGLGITAIVPS